MANQPDTTTPTSAPVEETPSPKVTRTKNPIMAYKCNGEDLDALVVVGGPFTDYPQFQAWVLENDEEGVEMIPMRVTGKSKTVTSVKKTTLV